MKVGPRRPPTKQPNKILHAGILLGEDSAFQADGCGSNPHIRSKALKVMSDDTQLALAKLQLKHTEKEIAELKNLITFLQKQIESAQRFTDSLGIIGQLGSYAWEKQLENKTK